jgi:hypothetical protein
MKRTAIALATLGVLLLAVPAMAQEQTEIRIMLTGNLFGTAGETYDVKTQPVPEDLVGQTCSGYAATENNASVWLNNDLIITSGGTSTEILNYERESNGITNTEETITLGDTIVVSIRLGPGGVSSEGLLIVLNCAQPQPPTTTTTTEPPQPPVVTTTTTTPPQPPTTTTAPPTGGTTTTEPPPEGGISAGGGGTAGPGNGAVPWLAAGGAALLAALALLAGGQRRTSRRE